jgi:hypothetical protein
MKSAMKTTSDNFLSLPAWFPADKAGAVLRNKGKRFALIGDRSGSACVVDLRQLASAPSSKSVSFCATRLGPAVSATASFDDVLRMMDSHQSSYLPVVVCGVMVSIVARDMATDAVMPQAEDLIAA